MIKTVWMMIALLLTALVACGPEHKSERRTMPKSGVADAEGDNTNEGSGDQNASQNPDSKPEQPGMYGLKGLEAGEAAFKFEEKINTDEQKIDGLVKWDENTLTISSKFNRKSDGTSKDTDVEIVYDLLSAEFVAAEAQRLGQEFPDFFLYSNRWMINGKVEITTDRPVAFWISSAKLSEKSIPSKWNSYAYRYNAKDKATGKSASSLQKTGWGPSAADADHIALWTSAKESLFGMQGWTITANVKDKYVDYVGGNGYGIYSVTTWKQGEKTHSVAASKVSKRVINSAWDAPIQLITDAKKIHGKWKCERINMNFTSGSACSNKVFFTSIVYTINPDGSGGWEDNIDEMFQTHCGAATPSQNINAIDQWSYTFVDGRLTLSGKRRNSTYRSGGRVLSTATSDASEFVLDSGYLIDAPVCKKI